MVEDENSRLSSDKGYPVRRFIEATKSVQKKSEEFPQRQIKETLTGEINITTDLTIHMTLKTAAGVSLNYYSLIFDHQDSHDLAKQMDYLIFEATMFSNKKQYTQLEVFANQSIYDSAHSTLPLEPKLLENEKIPFDPDEYGIPTNPEYLAFNYLTRHSSKARRYLDNYQINQITSNGQKLNYKHDIFISCPISYLRDKKFLNNNKEEFRKLKECVNQVIDKLQNDYHFDRNHIYCELANYDSIEEIPIRSRPDSFPVHEHINATHFISIIPDNLGKMNSGIYMEIYYRIQNKLPGLIYIEKGRAKLPSLLLGVLMEQGKPINLSIVDIDELDELRDELENGKYGKNFPFQFSL